MKKGLYIHSSFMSCHNDMHLAQTTITYVALSQKNLSDRSPLHSSEWLSNLSPSKTQKDQHTFMFPPSNYKILINQIFLAYWGFRRPKYCTKVLRPCFLQHIGVATPRSLHQGLDTLFSLAYWGFDTQSPHQGFDTLFLLHIGITTPRSLHQDFDTLISPTYWGHNTLIPAPWFLHIVFLFKSRFLHSTKVFTPCFLLFKSRI